MVRVVAPTRVDFTGGFTDIPPMSERCPAVHLSAAISLVVDVAIAQREDLGVEIALVLNHELRHLSYPSLEHLPASLRLVRTICDELRVATGLTLRVTCCAPYGAGLGASGALAVALVVGLLRIQGREESPENAAAIAARAEALSGVTCGCQDHYASALGGINRFCFSRGGARVERVAPSVTATAMVDENMFIGCPGGKRSSHSVTSAVVARYMKQDAGTLDGLSRLSLAVEPLDRALAQADIAGVINGFGVVSRAQRSLDPAVVTHQAWALITRLERSGIGGAKVLGGGGRGACILVACYPDCIHAGEELVRRAEWETLPVRVVSRGAHAS